MNNIIFSADDFGLCPEVNEGIIHSFNKGVLRATSIMVNQQYVLEAARLAYLHPKLNVGIHLNVTQGKPLTKGKSLIKKDGEFHSKSYYTNNPLFKFNEDELFVEFNEQILATYKLGLHLTHIDSHHHMHTKHGAFKVTCNVAKKFNLPVRSWGSCEYTPPPDASVNVGVSFVVNRDESITEFIARLKNKIQSNKNNKTYIICCHPSNSGDKLQSLSNYDEYLRKQERDKLCSKILLNALNEMALNIVGYKEVYHHE